VESIELRITKLRDPNGDLHIIPNGLITKVTNHSRGDMRIMVDVVIAHEVDVDKTISTLEELCSTFSKENENVVDGPKVAGVVNINDTSVTVRVVGKAKSMTQWDTENRLRKEIKVILDKANIEMPYQRRKIIN
jgi:small-conductance mechanosensitive channel